MEESEKAYDQRIRSAERAHDRGEKEREIVQKQIEAFSVAGMRAPALVAAGGVAASLGFYSANHDGISESFVTLTLFNGTIFWLFVALLCTLLSPGLAYLSQLSYLSAINHQDYKWEHPFIFDTPRSKRRVVVGDIFRWLAVLSVAASIICVGFGGYQFLKLISAL